MSDTALREIRQVRQHAQGPPRRWFSSPELDLFVWFEDGAVVAFEVCYDKLCDEHSLHWRPASGFTHTRIDDGEATPFRNDTPIAVPDGVFDVTHIALRFEAVAASVEPALYRFILARLYAGG